MPRNASGVYSPPGSFPPAPGSVISLDDYKALINDIVAELTDSLSRSNKGTMALPLRLADGAVGAPGLAFASSPDSGLFYATPDAGATDEIRAAISGALIAKLTALGVEVPGLLVKAGSLESTADLTVGGNGAVAGTLGVAGVLTAQQQIVAPNAWRYVRLPADVTLAAGEGVSAIAGLVFAAAANAKYEWALDVYHSHTSGGGMYGWVRINGPVSASRFRAMAGHTWSDGNIGLPAFAQFDTDALAASGPMVTAYSTNLRLGNTAATPYERFTRAHGLLETGATAGDFGVTHGVHDDLGGSGTGQHIIRAGTTLRYRRLDAVP